MNRKEAIKIVQGARQYLMAGNPIWDVKKIDEAMSMAIEALSAVCDDCIWHVCNYNKVDWDVPSAEAVQRWIPVSERLPDVGEIVIASWSDLWSDAIVFARRYCEDDWEWAYEQGSDYWEPTRNYDRESNPEAWMPLPEPYKGGDTE